MLRLRGMCSGYFSTTHGRHGGKGIRGGRTASGGK